jgi:hypothetical protein
MNKATLNSICTVYIPVSDEQRAIAWYTEKLGLPWVG